MWVLAPARGQTNPCFASSSARASLGSTLAWPLLRQVFLDTAVQYYTLSLLNFVLSCYACSLTTSYTVLADLNSPCYPCGFPFLTSSDQHTPTPHSSCLLPNAPPFSLLRAFPFHRSPRNLVQKGLEAVEVCGQRHVKLFHRQITRMLMVFLNLCPSLNFGFEPRQNTAQCVLMFL